MSFLQTAFGIGSTEKTDTPSATPSTTTNANANANANANETGNPGNGENNVAKPGSVWDNPVNQATQEQANPASFQNQQHAAAQKSPQEQFASHIQSLELAKGVDMPKIQEDMQNGATESMLQALEQVAANTYKATMLEMNSLVDSKIAQAKTETEQAAADNWNADLAVREMHAALPFTADPDIEPVATAVLNRFIKRGDSVKDSIEKTNAFFASTAEKINGASMPPTGGPGSTQFNQQQSNNNQQKTTSHDDWLAVLAQ